LGIRIDAFLRPRGKSRLLDGLLAAAVVVAVLLFLRALWQPVYERESAFAPTAKAEKARPEMPLPARSEYDAIAENDLFRQSRQKYVAPPKPLPKPVVIQAPPPPPLPKLTLIGTVIRDDGKAAILDYAGKSSYYRAGDDIKGFVIKDIRKDSVLLERAGDTLRVGMSQGPLSWRTAPNSPATKKTPSGQRAPVITPLPGSQR
jgi:type II secretory pathway component PulC